MYKQINLYILVCFIYVLVCKFRLYTYINEKLYMKSSSSVVDRWQ